MSEYFPIFVDVKGRRCLVVGGGSVALRKVKSLLEAGARVTVVAKEPCNALIRLIEVDIEERAFRDADLDGMFLVIASTNDEATNSKIAELAMLRGILVNAVDQPADGNFIVPAVVDRGPLTIAIGTSGASPSLAHRIRVELEDLYTPEYEQFVELLREMRAIVLETVPAEKRKQILAALASLEMFDEMRERGLDAARRRMQEFIEGAAGS